MQAFGRWFSTRSLPIKIFGALALVAVLATTAACSGSIEQGSRQTNRNANEKTVVIEHTVEKTAPKDESRKVGSDRDDSASSGEGGPDYEKVTDDTGAVSVEVPTSWDGRRADEAWPFEGEVVGPSVTAASDLYGWENTGGAPATFVVASKVLAQRYTDDQLLDTPSYDFSTNCQRGERKDFERGRYSGRIQAWVECFGPDQGGTYYTASAAPEGRECVVLVQVAAFDDEDRRAAQHVLDTFEAKCDKADPPAAVAEQPAVAPEAAPEPTPDNGYNPDGTYRGPCPEGQVPMGEGCGDPNAGGIGETCPPGEYLVGGQCLSQAEYDASTKGTVAEGVDVAEAARFGCEESGGTFDAQTGECLPPGEVP